VFLGAVPLLGLVGLLHRRLGVVSPFRPRGQHTPKGTRTRLAPTSASTRLPADYRDRATKVSNAPVRLPPGCPTRVDTPGEYTIPWAQNLDTASRPVLFFGGPQRRDAPKHPPRETSRATDVANEGLGDLLTTAPGGGSEDGVHLDCANPSWFF
jgi:hypothetical protein